MASSVVLKGRNQSGAARELHRKAVQFLSDINDTGSLMEIIRLLDTGSNTISCLAAVELIFGQLIQDHRIQDVVIPLKPQCQDKHKLGLRNMFNDCLESILAQIESQDVGIQVQALGTAMNLLAAEGLAPLDGRPEQRLPIGRLKAILQRLMSFNTLMPAQVMAKWSEYVVCADVVFYTWKLLPTLSAVRRESSRMLAPNEMFILNFLSILETLPLRPDGTIKHSSDMSPAWLCGTPTTPLDFDYNAKWLNRTWARVMHWSHTNRTTKRLLIVLLERVLPHLERPLILTDFLMDSLDSDNGTVAVMALQGVYTLMQKYNLDYPDIYGKLYTMFEPEIFHTKSKRRLCQLADTFLSSTHLPEHLVSAFAKRFARLALLAPSEDIIILCMMIGNLILRHPGLKRLLHCATGPGSSDDSNSHSSNGFSHSNSDPFIMEERDPLKSRAWHSYLWEIESLQQHAVAAVAQAAKFINNPLPTIEWDLRDAVQSGDELFEKEFQRLSKLVALNVHNPNHGTQQQPDDWPMMIPDRITQYWSSTI